ncbi:unnamed protein product [marine sediment metagenome]|uniref:Uncharacterized protein n=1 Tax=marine sediment metagenome TaxID=412755 RepID=X1GRP4_9ZZZZ
MSQTPVKKRFSRRKAKVLRNLLSCYNVIQMAPEPCHFFCAKTNTYIRVEVNDLTEHMGSRLKEFKEETCRSGEKIQVFLYKKHAQKPEVMEIK